MDFLLPCVTRLCYRSANLSVSARCCAPASDSASGESGPPRPAFRWPGTGGVDPPSHRSEVEASQAGMRPCRHGDLAVAPRGPPPAGRIPPRVRPFVTVPGTRRRLTATVTPAARAAGGTRSRAVGCRNSRFRPVGYPACSRRTNRRHPSEAQAHLGTSIGKCQRPVPRSEADFFCPG